MDTIHNLEDITELTMIMRAVGPDSETSRYAYATCMARYIRDGVNEEKVNEDIRTYMENEQNTFKMRSEATNLHDEWPPEIIEAMERVMEMSLKNGEAKMNVDFMREGVKLVKLFQDLGYTKQDYERFACQWLGIEEAPSTFDRPNSLIGAAMNSNAIEKDIESMVKEQTPWFNMNARKKDDTRE